MVINYTNTNYFFQALLSLLVIAVTINPIVNFVNITSDSLDKEFSVHHKEGKDISQKEKQIDSYDNTNTCPTFYVTTMHQKGERELIKHWNKPNINL